MLTTILPEYPWQLWKFPRVPLNFWAEKSNQKQFLEWVYKQLNMKDMEDWYNVTMEIISIHGGRGLLSVYDGSLITMLSQVFPEYNWLPWKFKRMANGVWDSVRGGIFIIFLIF